MNVEIEECGAGEGVENGVGNECGMNLDIRGRGGNDQKATKMLKVHWREWCFELARYVKVKFMEIGCES